MHFGNKNKSEILQWDEASYNFFKNENESLLA